MKKMLQRSLGAIVIIGMFCSLILSYVCQIKLVQKDTDDVSKVIFWQIKETLDKNKVESEAVREQFQRMCLVRAKAAAYIMQNSDIAVNNQEEMEKIAKLLEVDELHIFNEEGTIYAGSEPKYYGYNFNSGEQMRFFLPMLEDKSLELCQDVTPNTAEGKLMQYAAVWREDGQGIIQIGMEPVRLLEAMKKNELPYIFSLLTQGDGVALYAAAPDTYEILGSTDERFVGKSLIDIGIDEKDLGIMDKGFHAKIEGKRSYCIFTEMNQVLVGRICTAENLYGKINQNVLILVLCLMVIFVLMIVRIFRYLDKNIIQGIDDVNNKLQSITDGNLDEIVDVNTTPEFSQLSRHITQMVKSLLDTTDKLSSVLNMVRVPIGVYEYSNGMERVRITDKIPEILELSEDEARELTANYVLFEEKLAEIRKNPVDRENSNIFRLCKNRKRYIKIESYIRDTSFFGILMDVTNDMMERKKIEQERDEDLLTGLYNRRGFVTHIGGLFQQPDKMKRAALIMVDTDNLKMINDTHGHEAGNCYLKGMVEVFNFCTAPKQIAARLSGDEFSVLIYGCEDKEELQYYIDEIGKNQNGFEVEFKEGLKLSVEFSIGAAFYPEDGKECDTLLKCADERMYENKRLRKKKESIMM